MRHPETEGLVFFMKSQNVLSWEDPQSNPGPAQTPQLPHPVHLCQCCPNAPVAVAASGPGPLLDVLETRISGPPNGRILSPQDPPLSLVSLCFPGALS